MALCSDVFSQSQRGDNFIIAVSGKKGKKTNVKKISIHFYCLARAKDNCFVEIVILFRNLSQYFMF